MTMRIELQHFTNELLDILDETFENHHGIYLDKDTSLFHTLKTIDADQASIPVGGKCATLAAQVAHLTYYLEVLEAYVLKKDIGKVDWGEIWRRVSKVSAEEWKAYQDQLDRTYRRIHTMLITLADWDDERPIGGAMAMVVHTAYHLGEIRQALCTLRMK